MVLLSVMELTLILHVTITTVGIPTALIGLETPLYEWMELKYRQYLGETAGLSAIPLMNGYSSDGGYWSSTITPYGIFGYDSNGNYFNSYFD